MAANRLSKEASLAMGATTSAWVWSDAYAELHPPADSLSIVENDNEQTYRQFIAMAQREPNEKGTGRWKVTSDRRTVAILPIGNNISEKLLRQVQRYLSAFFHGLSVEIHSKNPSISAMNKKPILKGKGRKFPLKRCKIDGEDHIEVFSIFDALVHFVEPHQYCLIALTSTPICEEWEEDGISQVGAVLGRACGDRVCVVNMECKLVTLLATCTHESLHCFGFDHCTTFHCLMNSQSIEAEDCLFLSPLNLKKWIIGVMGIRHDDDRQATEAVIARYQAMAQVLKEFKFDDKMKWLNRKLKAVHDATGRNY